MGTAVGPAASSRSLARSGGPEGGRTSWWRCSRRSPRPWLLATFCAAERSRTAFDRLRDATHASDVALLHHGGNPDVTLLPVREATGVIDARAMSKVFVRPEGTELVPDLTLTAIAPRIDDPTSSVDAPVVTDGRAPRPDRPDEVALSAGLAGELGVEPGDELRLETMSEAWIDAAFTGSDPGAPDGPTIPVTVTGIARSPAEFGLDPSVIHLTASVRRAVRRSALPTGCGPRARRARGARAVSER